MASLLKCYGLLSATTPSHHQARDRSMALPPAKRCRTPSRSHASAGAAQARAPLAAPVPRRPLFPSLFPRPSLGGRAARYGYRLSSCWIESPVSYPSRWFCWQCFPACLANSCYRYGMGVTFCAACLRRLHLQADSTCHSIVCDRRHLECQQPLLDPKQSAPS